MHQLVKGIHHFQEKVFHEQAALFKKLDAGQSPQALFITCADSRIDPAMITQTKPGDLFVIRNAGNLVPTPKKRGVSAEEGAIEYGLKVLGIQNIIILGHANCGAIAGLLKKETLKDLPAVKSWLRYAKQTLDIVEKRYKNLAPDEKLNVAVQENVLVQLERLKQLPSVAQAIKNNTVNLFGLVYKIGTGEVFAYDPDQQQFVQPKRNKPLPEVPTQGDPPKQTLSVVPSSVPEQKAS